MFSFTQDEAIHFATFLLHTLKMFSRFNDQSYFEKQKNLPGLLAEIGSKDNSKGQKYIEHEKVQIMYTRAKVRIVHAFKACLQSGEYLMINNALRVIAVISPVFPTVECAPNLEKYITTVIETDSRKDLKAIAERTRDIIKQSLRNQGESLTSSSSDVTNSSTTSASTSQDKESLNSSSTSVSSNSTPRASEKVSGSKRNRSDYDSDRRSASRDSPSSSKASDKDQPPRKSSRSRDLHEPSPPVKSDRKEVVAPSSGVKSSSSYEVTREARIKSEQKRNRYRSPEPTATHKRTRTERAEPVARSDRRDDRLSDHKYKVIMLFCFFKLVISYFNLQIADDKKRAQMKRDDSFGSSQSSRREYPF